MRVIVAGSRTFTDTAKMDQVLTAFIHEGYTIVSGMAKGADSMAVIWAKAHDVQVVSYPADWDRYGRSAGMRRNVEMSVNADALIAFWDGSSVGTQNMIQLMRSVHKPIKIVRF